MWNEHRSLALSKLCVYLFMGCLVGALVAAPWLIEWVLNRSPYSMHIPRWYFYLTVYPGGVLAGFLLYDLYRLLHNLGLGRIFVPENEVRLRRISWYCIAGGAIALVSGFYYMAWFFVAAAAAFIGLIVRVVKNVIAEAILLKNESDYTI